MYALRQQATGLDEKRFDRLRNDTENLSRSEGRSRPRQTTASEVAGEHGISKSAFLERLHRAQHSLFTQLFGGVGDGHRETVERSDDDRPDDAEKDGFGGRYSGV